MILKKNILLIIFIFLIFSFACNSSKKQDDIIPKKEFIKILTEVHIADAVLTEKGLYDRKLKDSTASYYNYIFIKHRINRAKFDKSLQYYGKNTKELEQMYNQVIAELKEKSAQFLVHKSIFNLPAIALDQLKEMFSKKQTQLWTLKHSWSLPEDGKLNIIKFERKLSPVQAEYILSADYLVYKNDSSVGLTMLAYIFYKDGSHITIQNNSFLKDEKWHSYQIKASTDSTKIPDRIICKMTDHKKGTKSKHIEIRNIKLLRILKKNNRLISIKGIKEKKTRK